MVNIEEKNIWNSTGYILMACLVYIEYYGYNKQQGYVIL